VTAKAPHVPEYFLMYPHDAVEPQLVVVLGLVPHAVSATVVVEPLAPAVRMHVYVSAGADAAVPHSVGQVAGVLEYAYV
jgi:hypothetical protein